MKVLEEAEKCFECENAPCSKACPSGRDIPSFIGEIKEENINGALEILIENNPFPGACGWVCPAPCQDRCILEKMDREKVQIRDLEGYVAEEGEVEIEAVEPDKGKEVAIIGSGPAGLTAGYFLVKDGYKVDVYEKLPEAGGMLRYGVPDFRLPREILNKDIARIEKTGVEIKLETPVEDIDSLFNREYDALLVAIGAHKPRWVNIPGEELEGVIHAVPFLRKANLGQEMDLGEKVAVIGCGDVALDAVRFANKMGSEAFILYRRSKKEMPAYDEEYEAAREEGIKFNFQVSPKRILGENGRVTSIKCLKTELGEPDSSGRRRPVPIEESEFKIEVDNIIEAVSQQTDSAWLKNNSLEIGGRKYIKSDEDSSPYNTSREGVFAAGVVVTGTKTVSEAVGTAKKAVKSIEEYLEGSS